MDKDFQNLPTQSQNGNQISFVQKNMTDALNFDETIDGILMANSLHYVKNQHEFIQNLMGLMIETNFLIVEYDTESGNPWVPYPVSKKRLQNLFKKDKFNISFLSEKNSVYNSGKLYSAQIR